MTKLIELTKTAIKEAGKEEYIGHLAAIVESSEDAIISKSLTGFIRSWNKGGEKMFGYTSSEAIGKHISLITPNEFLDEELNIVDKIQNNESIDHYETVRIRKNGEKVYVSLTVSPLKDLSGRIIGVSKIARDITSRIKSEVELLTANKELAHQNEEKEKRAAELLIANVELAYQNEEKEKRAAELLIANVELAYQNEEKEKRAAELLIANIELAYQNEEKEKRAAELLIANIELAYQNEEKEKRAAELLIANVELAYQNEEKEKRAAELLIANIELAHQNEEKAKRAVELNAANKELAIQIASRLKEVSDYKFALDESSILSITDHSGIITYVNDNFCKISKYSVNELIGQDHCVLNSEYHSKDFMKEMWDTITNGKIWKGELKNKAKDGTTYWVDTTIVPFLDNNNKPYQYAALRADITLRKVAEEDIKILNDELESRVKERTEDLESFSYSVSHDLRAPLRAINGYARMFKSKYENQFDQEASRLVNKMVDNTTKMGTLIDDLLTFFRVGRREMNIKDIPMNELVLNICQELKNDQANRHIEFHVKPLPVAKADNTGLKQVWTNLISNAVKYSRLKEEAVIEIGFEIDGPEIIYYVKDNGAGFDMQYVSKLFNIFQRLHSEEEFEGTGVGLAIVQRIINKHGGRVWATSKINEETIFYFSLRS